jgi:hypothetical protein
LGGDLGTKWKTLIVKECLSEILIDDIRTKIEEQDLNTLRKAVCTSKADIRKLEAAAKRVRKQLDPDQWNDLKREIQEIKEDNRWIGTKRGKYVLAINEWVEPFHREFRAITQFEDAFIGGHAEKESVYVCGKVSNQRDYDDLLEFVESKNPPFKVIADVKIGDAT